MRYKYLIYDFDGTISDTYPVVTNALFDVLKEYGLTDTYESAYAKLKISFGYALGRFDFPISMKERSAKLNYYHHLRAPAEQQPFPEAAEILRFAKEHGGMNLIYTHSATLPAALMEKWGILGDFEEIINATYGFPRKPAPDALNYILAKYNMNPAEALMIGDRDIDIDAAHNAGIAGCLIDPGHYFDAAATDYRITNLLELKEIMLGE